jgi:protocatechuate 3,4-dioxygenase beta subunit
VTLQSPDDDDRLVGRVLSRRDVLALMGAASVSAFLAACAPGSSASSGSAATATATASGAAASAAATAAPSGSPAAVASALPACVVVPELTEGPYYVNENLDRSDIRVDTADGSVSEGAVLTIDWVVSQVEGSACIPLEGVLVDVWHCDALGGYSDVAGEEGHDYLRGYQRTDANGKARIVTVYPGWYPGRAVHIHFKIRTDADAASGLEFTSQLFFDDALSAEVYASGVYASKGTPDRLNAADGIYQQSQGMTMLDVVKDGDGYTARFEMAIQTA